MTFTYTTESSFSLHLIITTVFLKLKTYSLRRFYNSYYVYIHTQIDMYIYTHIYADHRWSSVMVDKSF